jgi:anti-anti-sigma regulatory factor
MAAQQTITRDLNRIIFSGRLNAEAIPLLLQYLRMVKNLGFDDFVLDFSGCNRAYTSGMVPLAALVDDLRLKGDEFDLISPADPIPARLFENTGLANFIAPQKFTPSNFQGIRHVRIQRFRSHEDQFPLVRSFMEIILKTTELSRDVFQGLEWSLNEVMDNIPNHAKSPVGGFASLTSMADSVSFTVADCGIGILASLREGYPNLANDTEALGEAIKGGVTRNKQFGQGNGLAGTLNIATGSGGSFSISSGRGRLNVFCDPATAQPVSKRSVCSPQESYPGTIVDVQVKKNPSFKMSDALGFTGINCGQFDYIEAKYETESGTEFMIKLATETTGFGSRGAGLQIRKKCLNLLTADQTHPLVLDWSGVPVISSSFADEAIGKLFVELGPLNFSSRVRNIGLEPLVSGLINKAILQRASEVSHHFTVGNKALENMKDAGENPPPE